MTAPPRALLAPTLVLVLVAGTLLSSALVPRDLSMGEAAVEVTADASLAAFDVTRAITAGVLALSTLAVVLVAAGAGLPSAGLGLWLACLAYVVSNFVLPAILGRVPGLDVRLLYPCVVLTALYFTRPMTARGVAAACKLAFGAFIYASLATALVAPQWAIAPDYEGLLPGLTFRLYGIGGGATSLGAMAAGYLVVEVVSPSRSWTRFLHSAVALVALVLAQSKAAWAFLALFGLFLLLRGRGAPRPGLDGLAPSSAGSWRPAWLALGVALAAGAAILAGSAARFDEWLGTGNLRTLTGRTYIWDTTIQAWEASPLFGYGVGLWLDQGFRAAHGAFAHAHNQFLHSLGSAGLVGLAGLIGYLGWAWRLAWRASSTGLVPLALVALLLAQCLTEVPLRHLHVLDAYTVIHVLAFASLRQAAEEGEGSRDPAALAEAAVGLEGAE